MALGYVIESQNHGGLALIALTKKRQHQSAFVNHEYQSVFRSLAQWAEKKGVVKSLSFGGRTSAVEDAEDFAQQRLQEYWQKAEANGFTEFKKGLLMKIAKNRLVDARRTQSRIQGCFPRSNDALVDVPKPPDGFITETASSSDAQTTW